MTGLGNYSRLVIENVAQAANDCEIRLFVHKNYKKSLLDNIITKTNVNCIYPQNGISRLSGSLWRSALIVNDIKKSNIDIFHGLSNELPFWLSKAAIHSVVTIHDLIFLTHPEYYAILDKHIYTLKARYACNMADKIIAVSERTKNDIIRFFNINPDKIEIVYQGCNDIFKKKASINEITRVKHKYMLPDNYILNVGTIEERKNALSIVKSMKGVDNNISLVIVGKKTPYTDNIRKYIASNGLYNRIKLLHNVPMNDLPALYQGSKLFLYPSYYEGFGIPIIEAINSGVPVIAAKGSCLEESGGEGAFYIDPDDIRDMRERINLILNHQNIRNMLIEKGQKHVESFNNNIQTEKIISIYNEILNK